MSKLPKQYQFLDLSDYGRPIARRIANFFKNTKVTPVDITLMFVVSGILAILCILYEQVWLAATFLLLKSVLDAADGELARIKKTPSYTGRYLDSVCDIILNFMILGSILWITNGSIFYMLLAFFGMQLQGTLYNYYFVILRNKLDGDTTSRIFENSVPIAMLGEKQKNVNLLHKTYSILYGLFDKIIYNLDKNAILGKVFPNWFMTLISSFGLGFQLLVIAILLVLQLQEYVFLYFMYSSFLIVVFIAIRKSLHKKTTPKDVVKKGII